MASGAMPPAQVAQRQGCNQHMGTHPMWWLDGRAMGHLFLVLGAEAASPG